MSIKLTSIQLQFRDGPLPGDPILKTLCGFEEPPPFLSSGNQLHVKFHSDWSAEGHGFLFRWEATDEGTARTTGTTPLSAMNGMFVYFIYLYHVLTSPPC